MQMLCREELLTSAVQCSYWGRSCWRSGLPGWCNQGTGSLGTGRLPALSAPKAAQLKPGSTWVLGHCCCSLMNAHSSEAQEEV